MLMSGIFNVRLTCIIYVLVVAYGRMDQFLIRRKNESYVVIFVASGNARQHITFEDVLIIIVHCRNHD